MTALISDNVLMLSLKKKINAESISISTQNLKKLPRIMYYRASSLQEFLSELIIMIMLMIGGSGNMIFPCCQHSSFLQEPGPSCPQLLQFVHNAYCEKCVQCEQCAMCLMQSADQNVLCYSFTPATSTCAVHTFCTVFQRSAITRVALPRDLPQPVQFEQTSAAQYTLQFNSTVRLRAMCEILCHDIKIYVL